MSTTHSDDQAMADTRNTTDGGKAIWDDKAVMDMYLALADIRGPFTSPEAQQVEQILHAKGYTFTAKQLQAKHGNIKNRICNRPATLPTATGEAKPKVAARKPRTKKEPATDANGHPKPKAAPKPRAKATAKKDLTVDANGDAVEAEGPPSKKRKAARAKASKKVLETVAEVKNEDNTEQDEEAEAGYSADSMKVDGQEQGSSLSEEYDAPEGEEGRMEGTFEEQFDLVESVKVDVEQDQAEPSAQLAVETLKAETKTVVQTSA